MCDFALTEIHISDSFRKPLVVAFFPHIERGSVQKQRGNPYHMLTQTCNSESCLETVNRAITGPGEQESRGEPLTTRCMLHRARSQMRWLPPGVLLSLRSCQRSLIPTTHVWRSEVSRCEPSGTVRWKKSLGQPREKEREKGSTRAHIDNSCTSWKAVQTTPCRRMCMV